MRRQRSRRHLITNIARLNRELIKSAFFRPLYKSATNLRRDIFELFVLDYRKTSIVQN